MRRGPLLGPWLMTLTALSLACDDPAGLAPLQGSHEVVTADGASLPTIVTATEECDNTLDDGAITFDDGTFELIMERTLDCSRAGGSIEHSADTITSTYHLDGRQIQLATVPATIHGTRTSEGVTLEVPLQGNLMTLRFRRVS